MPPKKPSAQQRALQSMTDKMKAMAVQPCAPGKKKRTRRRKNQPAMGGPTPGTSGSVGVSKFNMTQQGMCRMKRDELLASITTSNAGDFIKTLEISPLAFNWLKTVAGAFDRYIYHHVSFFWRPAVGTLTNGSLAVGVDYRFTGNVNTHERVVSLFPSMSVPVWQDTTGRPLVIPPRLLMSRREYTLGLTNKSDAMPGDLCVHLHCSEKSAFVGDLWVRYDVTFMGTNFS